MASQQEYHGCESESTTNISKEDVFDVLSNQRRRFVVHLLKRDDGHTVAIGDMAEQIAAWEYDIDVAEINADQRKRVYTALQQSHLPKLDETGLVEFNRTKGVVEPTQAIDNVDVYLDVVEGTEIPWSEYYIGLSSVAASLLAAVWIGAWPFVLLSDLAWTLAIVVAFAFSALAHKYYTAQMKIGRNEKPPELT